MFDDILKHRSGRVIALARTALAALFLFAIWVDPTQPAQAAIASYATLLTYVLGAVALTMITWNNWWADARLAAAAHVFDIAVFTLLVLTTDGYTSPFFVFFVFLILSAAIRWGWRETAITAVAVTLLYFTAGLIGGDVSSPGFDLQRFIIRSANLVILSAILIWFGINHGFAAWTSPAEDILGDLGPDDPPLEESLERLARVAGSERALLLWRPVGAAEWTALCLHGGEITTAALVSSQAVPAQAFLFDIVRNRALCRSRHRKMQFSTASALADAAIAERFAIAEGLAVPVRTFVGEGVFYLGGIDGLCTDHIEFGQSLSTAVSAQIQRHAFVAAVEEGAGSRARLTLARDLHDSIVQFLAGATFRVEAIKRSVTAGEKPRRELQDLKELLLQEQQELRSAIGALRSDRIALPRLADDLETLCDRLARQWDVRCTFLADVPDVRVPMRLHLDTHQLVREAVANAVRHAKAKSIAVQLSSEEDQLRLEITNDGAGSVHLKSGSPWSLRERVDDANGTLMLATRDSGTTVSITLPLNPEARL